MDIPPKLKEDFVLKRFAIIAAAVAVILLLTAGCGKGSTSTVQQTNTPEVTAEPSTVGTIPIPEVPEPEAAPVADNADSTLTEPKTDPAKAEEDKIAALEKLEAEKEKKQEAEQASKKSTKTEKKVQEAKKSNAAINKAVTDSIMDNQEDKTAKKSEETEKLKKAIDHIRLQIKDLKQYADSNDQAQMKDLAAQIVQSWEAMKADVQDVAPTMIAFIDEKIAKLKEYKDAESIDQAAVLQLDYELYQAFRQLADKLGVS
jgi:DNA polymerase III gamma/tau subunit